MKMCGDSKSLQLPVVMDAAKRSKAISAILRTEKEAQELVDKATEDVRAAKRKAVEDAKKETRELEAQLAEDFDKFKSDLVEETAKIIQQHSEEDEAFLHKLTTGIGDKMDKCIDLLYNTVVSPSGNTV